MKFDDLRDKELSSKILSICGYLARGDINNTDIDEWGASGTEIAKRLSKCIVCEHYGYRTNDGVGPECHYNEKALHELVVSAWGTCPDKRWGVDEETVKRFFYNEVIDVLERETGEVKFEEDDVEEESE